MNSLLALADDIAADRRISAEEATRARRDIFPDGVVSRQGAELLVALEGRVAESDEAWAQTFVEALADHVLQAGVYPGHVDDQTAAWLIATFSEAPRINELSALVKIIERAESTPESLREFVRARIARHLAGRALLAADVALVRRVVFARTAVTNVEIRWLFALDAESDGRENDPGWRDLFVKATLCHLAGKASPTALEEAAMEEEALQALEARLAPRPPVSPLSVLKGLLKGGFAGFRTRISEPNAVQSLEQRHDAAKAAAEKDAQITAPEAVSVLGFSKPDGKLTANEQALLAELRKLEAEQA